MGKLTTESLKKLQRELANKKQNNWIRVGMSTCGIAAGAEGVYTELEEEIAKRGLTITLKKCGCLGMCYAEPLVEVAVEGLPTVIYGKVNKAIAHRIIEEHVCEKRIISDYVYELRRL